MSRELEQRLERLLRGPRASDEVEQRALGLALAALPPPVAAGGNRRLRMLLLASAATLALLALAAAALATVGALHVTLGTSPRDRSPARSAVVAPQLQVPVGAKAVAAVVDQRLWLTTRSGLRIQGLPVQSATLSPHALYVAAGIGDSLVAMAPNGTRAWSRAAGGPVVAIAWAPDGLRIAYVVRRGDRFQLRTIEGNGIDDRLLDGSVRRMTPSWRADSLAVAYVGSGGRAVIYDFAHDSHRVSRPSTRDARQVAFAPQGSMLAIASAHLVAVDGQGQKERIFAVGRGGIREIAWVDGLLVVASPTRTSTGSLLQLFHVTRSGGAVPIGHLGLVGRVEALDANDSGIVVAVARARSATRLLASASNTTSGKMRSLSEVLLQLPASATIDAVSVR
jgi:hypothetical protein